MDVRTLRMINLVCFRVALLTIAVGVLLCICGVWVPFFASVPEYWKLLSTDIVVFLGAVLTNLAIKCYRNPDGQPPNAPPQWAGPAAPLPTAEEYSAGHGPGQ